LKSQKLKPSVEAPSGIEAVVMAYRPKAHRSMGSVKQQGGHRLGVLAEYLTCGLPCIHDAVWHQRIITPIDCLIVQRLDLPSSSTTILKLKIALIKLV